MIWVVLFFGIFFVFGSKADPLKEIVKANEKFTISVYKELIQTEKGNLVFSGLSAEIILSLLTNGAKGETQKQLLKALSLPNCQHVRDQAFGKLTTDLDINSGDLKLLSANKIYPSNEFTISKTFKDTAVNVYKSDVQSLNYQNAQAAADTINEWVEEHTNKKIQNLIDPSQLSPSTVLVLVNALYFSGDWVRPFEAYNTRPRLFYTSETKSKSINTMYTEINAKYNHNTNLKAKFLELDFKGGNVSIVFILPDSKSGLGAMEDNLEKYLAPVELDSVYVGITLPKFIINTKIDFTKLLQKLGVLKVFTNQAELNGISPGGGLKVSFIAQKAFVNVTETGVEAAAATAVGVVITAIRGGPTNFFNADHPFIFYIKDKSSGVILFTGRFTGL